MHTGFPATQPPAAYPTPCPLQAHEPRVRSAPVHSPTDSDDEAAGSLQQPPLLSVTSTTSNPMPLPPFPGMLQPGALPGMLPMAFSDALALAAANPMTALLPALPPHLQIPLPGDSQKPFQAPAPPSAALLARAGSNKAPTDQDSQQQSADNGSDSSSEEGSLNPPPDVSPDTCCLTAAGADAGNPMDALLAAVAMFEDEVKKE